MFILSGSKKDIIDIKDIKNVYYDEYTSQIIIRTYSGGEIVHCVPANNREVIKEMELLYEQLNRVNDKEEKEYEYTEVVIPICEPAEKKLRISQHINDGWEIYKNGSITLGNDDKQRYNRITFRRIRTNGKVC